MRIPLCILPVAVAGLLMAACGHTTGERVATGALGGAAVGAVVDGGTGALIGGAAGAVGGAAVSADHDRR
jgi:osmotically inducible lipoprotein OsmB